MVRSLPCEITAKLCYYTADTIRQEVCKYFNQKFNLDLKPSDLKGSITATPEDYFGEFAGLPLPLQAEGALWVEDYYKEGLLWKNDVPCRIILRRGVLPYICTGISLYVYFVLSWKWNYRPR